jgi:hypothetical protein
MLSAVWPSSSDRAKTYASVLYVLFSSLEFSRIRFIGVLLRGQIFTEDPPLTPPVCYVQYDSTLYDLREPGVLYVMI